MVSRFTLGWRLYVGLVIVFLFLPNMFIVLFSFSDSQLTMLPIKVWSLRWYRVVLSDDRFFVALINSLIVAGGAMVGSGLIGAVAAFAVARYRRLWPWLDLLVSAALMPIMLPGLVLAIALLSFYTLIGFKLSLLSVMVSHVLIGTPYVMLILSARLARFDFRVEEASRDLGASPWQTLRFITLPLVRPSIIGAVLLVAALSFDEFILTLFTNGGRMTLPIYIWSELTTTVLPTINVVATLLVTTSALLTAIAVRFAGIRF